MARTIFSAFWLLCLLIGPRVAVCDSVYTPRPGTTERAQIVRALRVAVAPDLGATVGPVKFVISRLSVQGDWAFLAATPQQLNGRPFDYGGTKYEAMIEDGTFDDWLCALLRRQQGRWDVIAFEIGATDVPYAGWSEQYHAPPKIFP